MSPGSDRSRLGIPELRAGGERGEHAETERVPAAPWARTRGPAGPEAASWDRSARASFGFRTPEMSEVECVYVFKAVNWFTNVESCDVCPFPVSVNYTPVSLNIDYSWYW